MTLDELTPLWNEFRTEFRPFAVRHAGDDLADDALSETYYQIARLLPNYENRHGKRGLFGWMRQVLHRVCVKMRCKERERRAALVPLTDDNSAFDYTCQGAARRSVAAPTDSDSYGVVGSQPVAKKCLVIFDGDCVAGPGAELEPYPSPELSKARQMLLAAPISAVQRETLLAILEGDSVSVIADRLGVSWKSIWGRYTRALETLKAQASMGGMQPA